MAIDTVRLTDLATPQFSPEIAAMRAGIATLADGISFAPEALRAQASAEVGLGDFGDADYEQRFAVLTAAIDGSAMISPIGRFMLRAQLVQLLKNRLLLADLLARHPAIHAIEIARPIIICGLPRTGTTHLHNLMAADPALRSLPYWESLEPIPLPAEAGQEPDPRLARCEMGLRFVNESMPHFRRMHEMTTWHVQPMLTPLAAIGLAIIMIGATVIAFATGGFTMALFPLVVGLLLAFVAFGRRRLAPHGSPNPSLLRPAGDA